MKNKITICGICVLISACVNFNEKVNKKLNILEDYKNGTLENELIIPPQYNLRPKIEKQIEKEKTNFFNKEYLTE